MAEQQPVNEPVSSETTRERLKTVLSLPVHSWLTDTTALVGARPIYVKIVWLAGFALCLAIFVTQVQEFLRTFRDKPETTTLKENSVDFEFPDLIICNKAVMSGSYPFTLDPVSIAAINNYVTQLSGLDGVDEYSLARLLLATIPYQLVSDTLGHRILQFVLQTTINGVLINPIQPKPFYSPRKLNCIRLEPSKRQRPLLSTEGSYLEIVLFLDEAFFEFPKTSSLLPIPRANKAGLSFLTWDFENGINPEGASEVNLYFSRPGHYPDAESMIQLGAGKDYQIDLEIERLILSKGMQCSSSPEPSRIISPYNGSEESYEYSEFLCRSNHINQLLMQQSGCVNHLLPRDRKFGNVSNCQNLSRVLSGQVTMDQLKNDLNPERDSSRILDQKAIQRCSSLRPCQTDRFKYSYSFSNWPRIFSSFQRDILETFVNLVREKKRLHLDRRYPGYDDMINVTNSLLNNLTTHNIVIGAGYLHDQVMRIRVFTARSIGSTIKIEKSYEFINLIADTGGLLGLYLGCSLLTVLEAVELLHDCLIACGSVASSNLGRAKSEHLAFTQKMSNDMVDSAGESCEQCSPRNNDSTSTVSVADLEV